MLGLFKRKNDKYFYLCNSHFIVPSDKDFVDLYSGWELVQSWGGRSREATYFFKTSVQYFYLFRRLKEIPLNEYDKLHMEWNHLPHIFSSYRRAYSEMRSSGMKFLIEKQSIIED